RATAGPLPRCPLPRSKRSATEAGPSAGWPAPPPAEAAPFPMLAQDVLEDPPVVVVRGLHGGVEAGDDGDADAVGVHREAGTDERRRVRAGQPVDRERLGSGHTERLPRRALRKLEGQHAHADEVGPVDAL